MSLKRSRSQRRLITLLMRSPGKYTRSPLLKRVKAITVCSLYCFAPTTDISPIVYCLPFETGKSSWAIAVVKVRQFNKKAKNRPADLGICLINLLARLSKSSFSFLIIINCFVQMFSCKIWP